MDTQNFPLLADFLFIFGVAIFVVYSFAKLKLPSIIGLLLTGLIIGPFALNFVNSKHEIEIFAEIGVILIMFTIGLEFSISKLMRLKKEIVIGGSLQIIFSMLCVFILYNYYELSTIVFIGFLFALSSTAIILDIIQKNGSLDSPYGKVTLAILIFQDIAIVPMMLLTPILAEGGKDIFYDLGLLLIKVIGLIVVIFLFSKKITPFIFYKIAQTRISELFLISTLFLGIMIIFLCHSIGLSMALGAFISGLMLSETEYNHQALGSILPFKSVFSSIFFVSIGMLLDISFLYEHFLFIMGLVLVIIILKAFASGLAITFIRYPPTATLISALTLAQIGEFSFVLSKVGLDYKLIDLEIYQYFLAVAIISMICTPFLNKLAPIIAAKIEHIPILNHKFFTVFDKIEKTRLDNHLVIIGYGLNGQTIAMACRYADIDYSIIETNPDTYKKLKSQNENVVFGDATNKEILHTASIQNAQLAVIVISDSKAVRAITKTIKEMNPNLHLIVRTRFYSEIDELTNLGADEVVPEELETAVRLFRQISKFIAVSEDRVSHCIVELRKNGMIEHLGNESI